MFLEGVGAGWTRGFTVPPVYPPLFGPPISAKFRVVLCVRTRAFRVAVVLFVALLAPYAPGCGDDHESGGRPGVVYEGGTNDEALDKLLATTAKSEPAKRPELVFPTRGAHVPAAPIPTFSWKASPTGFHVTPRRGGTKFASSFPIGPLREAKAHGTPVNGKAYLVVFAAPGQPTLAQVFTTKTTYVPDEATWTVMKNVRGDITITVTVGTFDNNNLVQDGGPFVSDSVPFTLGQQ